MRVPVGWLRELCPVELAVDEIAEILAWKGAHLESLDRPWSGLEGVVVARVLEVRDHPDAEKLCVATVDAGDGPTQVVVGVRNMSAGDLVPWARPGARVPTLEEPLGSKRLRGEVSDGMLCSPRELGVSHEHESGILLLPGDLAIGADIKAALELDDAVLDLEIESNRPDLLSILGIAREVAGATGVPVRPPEVDVHESDDDVRGAASVEVQDPGGCPRYLARVVRGLGAGRTPPRVQARLTASGVRPISPVVDATNYVMLELGQPLHAFDLARLAGPGIVVRRSRPGERLTTLDDVERALDDDLLICDLDAPIAIAGVMGGATSEVGPRTSDVLLESAHFDARSVLRTSRRLQLLTEASTRFSRGTDPEGVAAAAARCARLMVEWSGGGDVLRGAIDEGGPPPRRRVDVRPERATALLGYPVSAADAVEALGRIGIGAEAGNGRVAVEVPGFRPDLEAEVDLIEEIVRVQGYDRLPSTVPGSRRAEGEQESYRLRRSVREHLVRAGLREAASLSFASADDLALMGHREAVPVANPPSAEEPYLRTSLLPALLGAVRRNLDRGAPSIALFEIGHVFRLDDPVDEREDAAFVLAGEAEGSIHHGDRRAFDVFDVKGVAASLLDGLGVAWSLGGGPTGPFHPTRSAVVLAGDREIGVVGELDPSVAARLEIPLRVALAELDVGALAARRDPTIAYRELARFPPVRRDLAFLVSDDASAGALQEALQDAAGELLDRVALFDVFTGGALPAGRKSLAFALEFRAPDRTLTDGEVEPIVDAIAERLRADFGAQLRSSPGSTRGSGSH